MNRPRIPQDDIPWSSLDLFPSTASVVEPLQSVSSVMVRILPFPTTLRSVTFVCLEELVVQRERTFEDHKTTVVRTVLLQVHDTLNAVLETTVRGLVHVRPGFAVLA